MRPARCPVAVLDRIRAISHDQLRETILPVAEELPFVDWQQNSIDFLERRSRNIDKLVEEVWAKQ